MRCDSASERPEMSFASRLAALYAAIFVVSGIQLPFFPVWLEAKGLDARQIGIVLALPMLVRLLAIPLATRIADRREALRETLIAMTLASVAGYLLLGLSAGFAAIAASFAVASLAFTPCMPLIETYALKGLAARGRAYGPVRLWGSAAFVLGTFLVGLLSDLIAPHHLIWPVVGAVGLVAFGAAALAPLGDKTAAQSPPPAKPLIRDRGFIAVVLAASLVQASHAAYYAFSTLAWRAQGYDGTTIAALWALGVVAEIVLFAAQGRLPAFVTPTMLLMLGGIGGALRWTAMAFDPPMLELPLLQVLHAATFGASHLGALMYLSRTVPPGQGATAQGHLAIAMGLAMAAATGLSGLLWEAVGSKTYAAMSVAAIAGGVCALVAHRTRGVAAL
jgi:PPP family 3-phenylpropionic acid transporter